VSNDVSVIDVASLKVIKSIQVGELPWGVAISQQ
jgi:YVTN family beta-propeller protein